MSRAITFCAFITLLILALVTAGCGGGGGGGGGGGAPPGAIPDSPVGLTYAQTNATYIVGIFVNNAPSFSGGTPTTWKITPALPGGISFNGANGIISGVPAATSPLQPYVVTASNAGGTTEVTINIGVILPPPNALAYPVQIATYSVGIPIAANAPQATLPGGAYTIQPALPAGLGMNATSGVISGTPAAVSPTTTYTVTEIAPPASFRISELTITVELTPPNNLSYDTPVTYYHGITIPPNAPSVSGSPVVSYAISPTLSAGLGFNTGTGVIAGTPLIPVAPKNYTVTATNAGGSTSAIVNIEVKSQEICTIEYASPVIYIPNLPIAVNSPDSSCPLDQYSVDPPLPAGLILDADSGDITGTPTVATPRDVYTITGSGPTGSGVTTVTLTVGPVYEFSISAPGVSYPDSGEISFDVSLVIEENASNPAFPTGIDGFSMSLAHQAELITPLTVAVGADLMTLNGGTGPEFFLTIILTDGITVGVLASLMDPDEELVADSPREVVVITYETNAAFFAGNFTGASSELEWDESIGEPPVINVISNSGVSQYPLLQNGAVELDHE